MSKSIYNLNKEIESFVLEKGEKKYSIEELKYVSQYTGFGGLWNFDHNLKKERGLYEYYTPEPIIRKMVGLAARYGFKSGKVLEPSCGVGRFMHYFSPNSDVVGIELDKTSYLICKSNFPHFDIRHQSFNSLFVDRRGNPQNYPSDFSLIIGNPPYGDFAGRGTIREKQITKANNYVEYFITRGLDILKKNGLLIYVIPSSFLSGSKNPVKEQILEKAELVDAYRLPKGVFKQTDIQTDIVVFKKKQ